jgi:hypothetical protein
MSSPDDEIKVKKPSVDAAQPGFPLLHNCRMERKSTFRLFLPVERRFSSAAQLPAYIDRVRSPVHVGSIRLREA